MTQPNAANMFKALSARQMVPMTNQARKFTAAQVFPFCEQLVATMNRMLPARFALTKLSDTELAISVVIRRSALETGGEQPPVVVQP
jgi:hypothetical protein